MPEEAMVIVPYKLSWPKKFIEENKRIEQTLGSWITGGVRQTDYRYIGRYCRSRSSKSLYTLIRKNR